MDKLELDRLLKLLVDVTRETKDPINRRIFDLAREAALKERFNA